MPAASFRHQAHTPLSPPEVWKRLQNPELWAAVAGVDSTSEHSFDTDDLTGFRFTSRIAGINYHGEARVTESRPDTAITLEIRSRELAGEISVALNAGSGTTLVVSMTMRPVGLMGSMIFGVVNAAVANGFADTVDRLAAEMV